MRLLSRFRSWTRTLLHRSRLESDMDTELRSHIAAYADDLIRTGISREEALQRARLEFGGIERIKEECRESRGITIIESLLQDIRFAFRMLRKSPGFTAVAVLTLGLGIGANTAIFSAAYSILFRPLSYQDSNRLVVITVLPPGAISEGSELSLPAIEKIKSRTHVFDQVIAVDSQLYRLASSGVPAILETGIVSGDYFQALGMKPLRGRSILPSDARPNSPRVAVLSYSFWQKHFRGDPAIVGKQIDVVDAYGPSATPAPYTVIGIAPASFLSPGYGWDYDIWIPEKAAARDYPYLGGGVFAVGRLRPGVTVEKANDQLRALSSVLASQYPQNKGWELHAQLLQDMIVHKSRIALLVLLGAVGFLLLIACVNVSNLCLTRAWGRLREIAIREALGATRLRILRQLLTETILLALFGCILGLFLGYLGIGLLRANAPEGTPRVNEIGLYAAVFWYAFGISAVAGVAFGLGPALQVSTRNLLDVLKGSRTILPFASNTKRRPTRYAGALIISEVALSVVLLVGSVLMIRSFDKLISVPLGFRTDHILKTEIDLDPASCKGGSQCSAVLHQMVDRIRSLPGAQLVGLADYSPLEGGSIFNQVVAEGAPAPIPGQPVPSAKTMHVSASYFSLLGIRLLAGRDFVATDSSSNAPQVAIVNRAFERKFFAGSVLGKRLQDGVDKNKKPIWTTIVGVVSDARDSSPEQAPIPELYYPFAQANSFSSSAVLLVRTASNPDNLAPAIRDQIWAVRNSAVVDDTQTMDQLVARTVAEPKFQTFLLASFAALGLLLAAVGIYGVISYSVSQRTHEIGVRLALGADRRHILRFVVGNAMLLTFAGIAVGIAFSFALVRFLRSLLFEVKPTDPLSFIGVAVLFFLVALAACYIPARRAMKVDPMVALRYE
jgi:putative ABC transport system permease protein